MITTRTILGIVAAALLVGLALLFILAGGDVSVWLASLANIGWYVAVGLLLVLIPVAIVGGAVWLAGRILHGTGSGGN